MKRYAAILILFMATAAAAFGLESYIVQTVTGQVEREAAGGALVAVKPGDLLTGETVLHTGAASSVIIKAGETTYTIGAFKTESIAALTARGIRIGGAVSQTNTDAVDRSTKRQATASARAGNAVEEEDLYED
jgi:hypothetical protein